MITSKKTKGDKEKFDKKRLWDIVYKDKYSDFPNDPYEPSNCDSIDEDKLTYNSLSDYLSLNYAIGSKPEHQLNAIKSIIDVPMLQAAIQHNKSEYFKVLTHFGILSKIQQGWYNLFVTSPLRKTKPSLSDHPARFAIKDKKKLHDAIIRCYYSRLISGMSEKDKERYYSLLPHKHFPTAFDLLLLELDDVIQILFTKIYSQLDEYNDEKNLPDTGLNEAIHLAITKLEEVVKKHVKNNISEPLRVLLIKLASLNRAINDVDAILAIQNQVLDSLPKNLESLRHVQDESEILPAISNLRSIGPGKFPNDLIKCAKVVCRIYIDNSNRHCRNEKELADFEARHMQPNYVAVAAALLHNDFVKRNKINLNIAGEPNPQCLIFKEISRFSQKIDNINDFDKNLMWDYALNQELIKFIVTRHSISINSLSDFYSSEAGAEAHLKVRRAKLELQREMYQIFKTISIDDAISVIHEFYSDPK